jgi:uncharacterized protein with gpF-like domain
LGRYAAKKITGIAENVRTEIRNLMLSMVQEGKSNAQITKEIIRLSPSLSRKRAATIARTETHQSAMAAIDATLQHKRIAGKSKTWWSAQDDRVRASHSEAHGQTVAYDQPFDVGGAQMMRPGDPNGATGASDFVSLQLPVWH